MVNGEEEIQVISTRCFASIILAQSDEELSSETDILETHSFLLLSIIHSSRGEQYVGWRINYKVHAMCRCSCSQPFFKIGVLKNFAIFKEKHLCWSLFVIKLQAWRPAPLLKRASNKVFSCEYCENFKNGFFCRTPLLAVSECDSSKTEQ